MEWRDVPDEETAEDIEFLNEQDQGDERDDDDDYPD